MRIVKLARFLAPKLLPLAALAVLAGCATPPPASDPEALAEYRATNDPLEPFNRAMYATHTAIDTVALRPVARGYRTVLPQPVRTGVRNALHNIRTPIVLLNDMLQGQPRRAGDTLGRFVLNTTLGLGGFFDVANDHFGVPFHNEDFGQTLASWGVGSGPYLFVPILGPSSTRDLAGTAIDLASHPMTWFGQGLAVDIISGTTAGLTVVDLREFYLDTLDEVSRTSLDPYATIRSASRQSRAAAIANNDAAAQAALRPAGAR